MVLCDEMRAGEREQEDWIHAFRYLYLSAYKFPDIA